MSNEKVTDLEAARQAARNKVSEPQSVTVRPAPDSLEAMQVGFPWRDMTWDNWVPDEYGLPPDCPVIPLGRDGPLYCMIDSYGELRQFQPKNFTRNDLISLFDRYPIYPKYFWPKTTRPKKKGAHPQPTGEFHADHVAEALMQACSRKNAWTADEKMRGVGAWLNDDGRLVLHLGQKVMIGDQVHEPGEIGKYFYPKAPASLSPKVNVASPGEKLLKELLTWNYKRGDFDAHLVLGWAMSALVGGALAKRPILYIGGPKGNGKSSLMEFLKLVMGNMPYHSGDTTAAAVRQTVGQKSIPVMLDETTEARENNRKAHAVLELARIAYDGSSQNRGSSDHKSVEFRVHSSFLLASILKVGITPQDRSRMAFVDLLPFPEGSKEPVWNESVLREIGAGLLARWQRHFGLFMECLDAYKEALREIGHDPRGQATFGTLAAAAHIAIYDRPPEDQDLQQWSDWLSPEALSELQATETDADSCVQHMMTVTTREMEQNAATYKSISGIIASWDDFQMVLHGAGNEEQSLSYKAVNTKLAQYGMKLIKPKGYMAGELALCELFVSASMPSTQKLFAGTHWGDNAGGQGTWIGALQNLGMEDDVWRFGRTRILGNQRRGIFLRLPNIIDVNPEPSGE